MAMIWGCSRRISSATARPSIHFRASRPFVERPTLMRSMMPEAFSGPSASTSTLRRNSSVPTPTEVCSSTVEVNSEMTLRTSSLETFCSFAMAAPMRCTSLAPICFNTSAASFSPRVSNRIAARSVPVRSGFSFIIGYPTLDDLRNPLRVRGDQGPCLCDLLLMSDRGLLRCARECHCVGPPFGARAQLRLRAGGSCVFRQNLYLHLLCGGCDQVLHQRPDDGQHENQQDHETAYDLRDVQEQR